MQGENAADDILVDFNVESQADLLRNAPTTPHRIPLLHLDDGVNQFLRRTFGSGAAPFLAKTAIDTFVFVEFDGILESSEVSARWLYGSTATDT